MFTGLQFLSPLWLWGFVPFLGLLFFLYRRGGKGRRVVVGTLFLLQHLKKEIQSRQKFFPPPRFFFDLLLGLLLLFALSKIVYKDDHSKIAILLDNSMSTSAILAEDSQSTAFQFLVKQVQEFLKQKKFTDTFDLITSTPVVRYIVQGGTAGKIRKAVREAVYPIPGSDNLESVVEKLIASEKYSEIAIFTDRPLSEAGYKNIQNRELNISVFSLPQNQNKKPGNVAIRRLGSRADSQQKKILQVELQNFSNQTISGTLHYTGYEVQEKTLYERESLEVPITFGEDNRETLIKELKILPDIDLLKTYFRLENNTEPYSTDALSFDNEAYLAPLQQAHKVLIVSSLSKNDLGSSLLNYVEAEVISPDKYLNQRDSLEAQKQYEAIVFHRFVPGVNLMGNTLFVLPEERSDLFSGTRQQGRKALSFWKKDHPTLRYLDLSLFRPGNPVVFDSVSFAEALFSVGSGPIALVGEQNNYRFLVFGFEIFPFEGKKSPLLSVLTLNSLSWLRKSNVGAVGAGENLFDLYQDGKLQQLLPVTTDKKISLPGAFLFFNANKQEIITANAYSEDESNLRHIPLNISAVKNPSSVERELDSNSLQMLCILIVFSLLVIDSLFLFLRSRRSFFRSS